MNKEEKIIKKLIEHDESLKEIREEMTTKKELREVKSDVLSAVDAVMKKLDNIEHAFVSNLAAHDRFEEAINNLNSRVTQLEKRK
jgi:hypothetical protein